MLNGSPADPSYVGRRNWPAHPNSWATTAGYDRSVWKIAPLWKPCVSESPMATSRCGGRPPPYPTRLPERDADAPGNFRPPGGD